MNEITLIIENEKYKQMVDEYNTMVKDLLKEIDKRNVLIKELQAESKERGEKLVELYDALIETQYKLNAFTVFNPN